MTETTAAHPHPERAATWVKFFVAIAVSLVVQFGLAIVGWGGWNAFFSHPALQALGWVSVALSVMAVFSGSSGLSRGANTGHPPNIRSDVT